MQLPPVDRIYAVHIPLDNSWLQSLRHQLLAVVHAHPWHLARTDVRLIPCRLVQSQPLTYVSALPQQLLTHISPSMPDVQTLGKHLLAQLPTIPPQPPATSWLAWVNEQGYLCLQPSPIAIAHWLDRLLCGQQPEISSVNASSLTSTSSIALQYIYTRCTQLRRLVACSGCVPWLCAGELLGGNTPDNQLVAAIVDMWDASIAYPTANRQVLATSRRLVERFLEFEQTCHLGDRRDRQLVAARGGLVTAVQITVGTILQRHWQIQPRLNW